MPPADVQAEGPGTRQKLSNERTLSRWAYLRRATTARAAPSPRSSAVKRLPLYTADGTRELVLALAQRTAEDGSLWIRARLPMRPNGTTGWIRRQHLERLRAVSTFLRIDTRALRATLYRRGRVIWQSAVGVGQPQWATPTGRFYVRERLIPATPGGVYGVFAFGLSAYSPSLTDWPGGGVIGVHGTNQPYLIPGRISHGCVRVANHHMTRLRRLMPLGTPVQVV